MVVIIMVRLNWFVFMPLASLLTAALSTTNCVKIRRVFILLDIALLEISGTIISILKFNKRVNMKTEMNEFEYVGFWPRVGAALIDSLLLMLIIVPVSLMIWGDEYFLSDAFFLGPLDVVLNYVLPAIAVIMFWVYLQATPGKMAVSAKILDAKTGRPASTGQLILRYIGYYVATLPLLLGIIWVAFDPRKQGWHDKIAGTVVIRPRYRGPQTVTFERD